MKVALVYDRVNQFGGAERVLLALHQIYPHAPLYTAVYNRQTAKWADVFDIKTTFLQHFPYFRTHHQLLPLLTPMAFAKLDLSNFDVIISVSSAEAKFVTKNSNQLHVCYCLTPTRYLWSHRRFYQRQGIFGFILKLFSSHLRRLDFKAATKVDHFIAISTQVQKRLKAYYHRPSLLIYPPVNTQAPSPKAETTGLKDFYLAVSRLVEYKRLDLAIKACNQLKRHLVIVGTGPLLAKLKKIAGPTINFGGQLTDSQLSSYYKNCRALIFATNDDFGIVPVEAQAHGKPVIALAKGGALETVISGKTGVFFDQPTQASLVKAILKLEKLQKQAKIKASDCRQNAQKFDQSIFKNQFKNTIEKLYQSHLKN